MRETVLELVVRNHPGAMLHIAGLFARRAFNLEAIRCEPVGDGTRSAMRLRVKEDARLPQLVRQLEKLYDVLSVVVPERGESAQSQAWTGGSTSATSCRPEAARGSN